MMSSAATAVNPFNDLPTVRLLESGGTEVGRGRISQREASRLLRCGAAELLLEAPPAVRLLTPPEEERAPGSLAGQYLHARKGALYGNVRFEGPGGETMFHGDDEKALWYLTRGLVEVVSRDPPVLRFRFEPGGRGHAGDDYYLAGKVNRCVVCGVEEGLNRHHVVPSVYRRHLPAQVKDHSHHDVLLLCLACHEKYEEEANRLKAELGEEHGVPLHGLHGERDRERNKAVKLALALVRQGERIPAARQEEMRRLIGAWAGREVGAAEVAAIAALAFDEDGDTLEHGRHVVAQTADVQGFVRRWREHFVRTMQPRYLPEHWDVDRPARRGEAEV
jgi:hypothetical protein